ncbi:Sister chromatid cohesion protein pds5 [Thecaphora frezii]
MATQTQTRSESLARLSVRGKLYQKGGSTDTLLKRLKAVRAELSEMDQDYCDVSSLEDVRKELVSPALMLHKDKAVKAYVACCLADMLRLYAPNAPYTQTELRDIFQFFIHQLTVGLAKPSSPQYSEHFYLLESLSHIKSVVLVCDLTNADELMTEYFKGFFEQARPDLSKNVELCMNDILVALIDECQTLPIEVLELLLANFSPKAIKHNPAAHRMTAEICSATADKLQKYVAQYFTEVIVSASREDDQDERMEALQSAHALILQINRSVPALLLNVVPQLEEELRAEDAQLRIMATKVLGQMFAERPSSVGAGGDLATKYAATWKAWLGRANDKSATLRTVWVEATKNLLIHHPELRKDLTPILEQKLLEPDERVRAAMAKTLGSLDYETALHHVDKSVLIKLVDRCKDKKASVRREALEAAGKMFDNAFSEIESHDRAATLQFAWIPSEILKCVYTGGPELLQAAAAAVEQHILPLPADLEDEASWTNRLLLVMKFLDPEAIKALFRLTNLIFQRPCVFDHFVSCCEEYNGGDVDKDKDVAAVKGAMADSIRRCSTQFGDPQKAQMDLHAFAKLNDARIYRLLKTCLDPQQDLKSLAKARADALRRVENANATILDTMTTFIRSGSFFLVNRSSIPTLVKRLQQNKNDFTPSQVIRESQSQGIEETESQARVLARSMAQLPDMEAFKACANEVLEFVAKHCPQMFVAHVAELCRSLHDDGNRILVQTCLQALAALAQWNVDKVQLDKKTIDRAARHVHRGTPLQAKFAAKLLAIVGYAGSGKGKGKEAEREKEPPASRRGGLQRAGSSQQNGGNATSIAYQVVEEVLETLARELGKTSGERQVASLEALAQLFKHAPDATENVADTVVKTLLAGILCKPNSARAEEFNETEDWIEDEAVPAELQAKLLSLTVLTKRCAAFAETSSAGDVAKPVFRLLWTVIAQGEAKALRTPASHRSRMRLQAATCVLKLARYASYEGMIGGGGGGGREYFALAFTVQDECFHVRSKVLHRLLRYLARRKIDARFLAMAFLAALDPEEENRQMVQRYCTNAVRGLPGDMRLKLVDVSLPRFLHLLAHHPDFSREGEGGGGTGAGEEEGVVGFVRYMEFFLDCVCTAQNVGLLFYLASRLKGVRDGESQGASENLYTLSEMAQLVIKRRAEAQGWTVEAYPGKITMPADIFKPLPSREVQREIYDRQYLAPEVVQMLSQVKVKKRTTTTTTRKRKSPSSPSSRKTSTAKKRAPSKRKAKKKKPKYGYDSDENASQSDEDEEDIEEEEEEDGEEQQEKEGAKSDVSSELSELED